MPGTVTAEREVAASDIDPFSRRYLADPYPFHERLRAAGPVVRLESLGVWATGRYEQVQAILNDWQTYCSSAGVGIGNFHKEKNWRAPSLLLESDPPVHTRARAILARVLSPAAIRRLRDTFHEEAVRLVEPLIDGGGFDAIADLARPYPLKVFPDAVGIVDQDRENLIAYGDMVFNALGPRNELYQAAMARADEVVAWVTERCQRRTLAPAGLGADVYKAVDAGEVTEAEAALLVRSFLTAGVDTTINAIGNALFCFAEHPDQWRLLRDDPSRARSAFEEVMRFESPFQTFFRTTTRAVEIAGTPIGADEKILLAVGAANRDPRFWQDPTRFDISRPVVKHVGFGAGIHGCVGQMIARLEIEVILSVLAARVERIDLDGTPECLIHNTLRAFTALPVRMTARRRQGAAPP